MKVVPCDCDCYAQVSKMEMSDIMIRAFAHRIGGADKDVIDRKCWMHYLHTQVDHADDDGGGEVIEPSRA